MQKSIDNTKEVVPEEPKHKGKKNKRSTACVVLKNKWGHCGICGSEDLVYEIYVCCNECGKDVSDLSINRHRTYDGVSPCKCKKVIKYKNKTMSMNSSKFVREIANCNTCGAYMAPLCRNCKEPMWYRFDENGDKMHCTGLWSGCGFRINI